MITVTVSINGHPVITRSARNTDEMEKTKTRYFVDDGRNIWHKREDGAATLAIEMLKGVKTI